MTWTAPEHDPARELRDHASPEEWERAIVAIAGRHDLRGEREPMTTGSDVVWAVGASVVKLTAPRWSDEIDAEVRNLRHVAGRLSVATPEVVAKGTLGDWPYAVMTRVPGRALGALWPALTRADRLRLAADLGRVTAELHALDPAGYTGAEPGHWEAHWTACLADVAGRHARDVDLPLELVAEIPSFLDAVGVLATEPRVPLHTELLGEHVLALPDGNGEPRGPGGHEAYGTRGRVRLASLIDFADGRVGPAPYEWTTLGEFVFRAEPGLQRAYLEAYDEASEANGTTGGARELTPECLLAWNLCHRFGRLKRLLAAVAPRRPGTLRELAQVLYGS